MAFDEDIAKKLKQGFEKKISAGAEKAKSNHKPEASTPDWLKPEKAK